MPLAALMVAARIRGNGRMSPEPVGREGADLGSDDRRQDALAEQL